MNTNSIKLLTIFTELALESRLVSDLEEHNAPGYTITNARGKGHRGLRSASWEANSNIRIEVICKEEVAINLAKYLQEQYYDNYAMVTFIANIDVLRPEKFS